MRYLKRLVLAVILFLAACIITWTIGFYVTGAEPSTLITCTLGAGGVELLISGALKIMETAAEYQLRKKERNEKMMKYGKKKISVVMWL